MRFSSEENDAPFRVVVAMNCSIVYCFGGRAAGWAVAPAAIASTASADPARPTRPRALGILPSRRSLAILSRLRMCAKRLPGGGIRPRRRDGGGTGADEQGAERRIVMSSHFRSLGVGALAAFAALAFAAQAHAGV